jgi:hypothetical protein
LAETVEAFRGLVERGLVRQWGVSNLDETHLTVEVVWSTGAKVSRHDRGRFTESLSLEPKHVRLDRPNAGASVLDHHSAWGGVRAILGGVERAWLVNGEERATLRFSERADVRDIVRDVKRGIIRHISVGYRVLEIRDDTEKDANVKRFTAVDWKPFEVSIVTIPTDAKAGVRGPRRSGRPGPARSSVGTNP